MASAPAGRRREVSHPVEQGDQVLEGHVIEAGGRTQVGQPQSLVAGILLHVGQSHLELGPPVGRGAVEQVSRRGNRARRPAG